MKVGIVSRFLPEKDGIAIYSNNLVKNLRNLKVNVVRIGTLGSETEYKLNFASCNFYESVKKVIDNEGVDLIHFQYISPWYGRITLNYPLIRAIKKIKIPKIVTLHEVQYLDYDLKNKILALIEKKVVKYSDKIITHTDQQAEFINKKYSAKKAECIYMGVTVKKVNVKKGKNILFFGMMSEGKGVIDLINARKYLPNDVKMIIAGRPVAKEYEEKIRKAAKNTDVQLKLGWISEEEKDKLYRWANAVVLPYRWAPYQSAVLADAVSYGLPVVVTKVGAVWEIVDKFKIGNVVELNNAEKLAEAIKKVCENSEQYAYNLKSYQEESNWLYNAKKHLHLYESIIRR